MTTVSILAVTDNEGGRLYQAVAGDRQCNGKTPGEALDAIAAQLGAAETSTLVILQNNLPDAYFSGQQRSRLEALMHKWRASRDSASQLSSAEQTELDSLVAAEIRATSLRAKSMADSLDK